MTPLTSDPQGCGDAAELGHSCDLTGDAALRRQAEAECQRLMESPFSQCHQRVSPSAGPGGWGGSLPLRQTHGLTLSSEEAE